MVLKEYPILNTYIEAVRKTRRDDADLATIFLVGAVSELTVREIMDDEQIGAERLIIKALDEGKISVEEEALFQAIRERRNKYVHINAQRILDDYQYFTVGRDGLLDNINEIALADFSEKALAKVLTLHIKEDAAQIFSDFEKLVSLLE